MKEIYKNIENTNYSISNLGNLMYLGHKIMFNTGFIKEVKPYLVKFRKQNNYYCVTLNNYYGESIRKNKYPVIIHRLVAEYFVDNPNNYTIVNHLNGNKLDNRAINLEWTTVAENVIHAWKTGLNNEYNRQGKLKQEHISIINNLLNEGFNYREIEKKLGFYKTFLTQKKIKTPNQYLIKQINKDKNTKMLKNANQEFVSKINNLIIEGLRDFEIEKKLELYPNYLSEMRRMDKFKNFKIIKANRYQKLNHHTCLNILKDKNSGMKIKEICDKYKIDKSMIYRIKDRKDFQNVYSIKDLL